MSDEFVDEPLFDSPAPIPAPITKQPIASTAQDHHDLITKQTEDLSISQSKIDTLFIKSTVSSPSKENDGQNAYITYLVSTITNNPIFNAKKFEIRRRFSDFVFLYDVLSNDHPECVIPPLPDKQRLEYLKGDRFSPEFTEKRCQSLQRFLKRIEGHPVLKKSKIYHIFLESTEWGSYKVNLKIKSDDHGLGSGSSLTSDGGIITDVFINAFKSPNLQSKEFIIIKEKSEKLDENIARIDKIFQKIMKRYGDLEQDYYDFSYQIKKIAELEPELEIPFVKFSEGLQGLSLGFAQLKQFLDNEYLISLKDLEHYINSVRNLIKLKDQKQMDFEAISEYLERSIHEKNVIITGGSTGASGFLSAKFEELTGQNPDLNKREKLNKLESKIEKLSKELDISQKVSQEFEKSTLKEVNYFDNVKSLELKESLGKLADKNIEFYETLISKWEDIEKSLA
ncbi:hypothetical protein WICPIJ_008962 [Wickerhamomyces pijperi]|uniref:Sorting nexin-4 n=1 Tax=Wickerhamomyces pijperi TaxID=599730 RepID=A0A9P8TGA7_WICPI|nr:hypothetical protein WICPIJ_008962 [Wickerhamomyces pijperi]